MNGKNIRRNKDESSIWSQSARSHYVVGLGISFAQNGTAISGGGAPNATSEVKNDAKIEGLKTDDIHIFVSCRS